MNGVEMIVKREPKYNHVVVSILLYAFAALCSVGLYLGAGNVAFYPMPFLFIGAWLFSRFFKQQAKVEFEYSFLDGTFAIDKLLNQVKRIPVLKLEISEIAEFGVADARTKEELKTKVVKVIECDTRKEEDTSYYFVCKYNDSGLHAFIFTPDEKFLRLLANRNQIVASALRKTNFN